MKWVKRKFSGLKGRVRSAISGFVSLIYSISLHFLSDLDEFVNESGFQKKGGLKYLSRDQWKKYSIEDYGEFVYFRHSVRDFSGQPVDDHVSGVCD